MQLFDVLGSTDCPAWNLGARYEITRRPKGLKVPATVSFIPMDAIPSGGAYDPKPVQKKASELTSGTYFERGDLLISKITPSFENGKQALTRVLGAPFGFATTEVIPIRPTDVKVDVRFLFFYLLHPEVREFVASKMEGSTGRQRVSDSVLLDVPVPAFPPDVETAIANVLELVQVEIQAQSQLERNVRELKTAAMDALFTNARQRVVDEESQLSADRGWRLLPLGKLCTPLSGGTPPKSDPSFWQGPVPWVSGKDLKTNRLFDVADHISTDAAQRFSKVAPRDSVLVLIRGMGLAKKFALSLIERPMAFNQDIKALIPGELVTGAYLMHALTHAGNRMLMNVTTAAHGTKRLVQADIDRFDIPVPPPSEQSSIVNVLDHIDRKLEIHERRRTLLNTLFETLLHKLVTREVCISDLDLSRVSRDVNSVALA